MISLPNEPPSLRQLSHLRNISWFGLLPPWQAVTCGSTQAQQQFGRLPSADSAHSFVPLFVSLPSFSLSSAILYAFCQVIFCRVMLIMHRGKVWLPWSPQLQEWLTAPKLSPSLAEPELSHHISSLPMETGAMAAADWTGEIIRPFDSEKFRSNPLAQWITENLCSSGSLASSLPFFHCTLAEIPGSTRLVLKCPLPRYFLSLLFHGRRFNSCWSCFFQK